MSYQNYSVYGVSNFMRHSWIFSIVFNDDRASAPTDFGRTYIFFIVGGCKYIVYSKMIILDLGFFIKYISSVSLLFLGFFFLYGLLWHIQTCCMKGLLWCHSSPNKHPLHISHIILSPIWMLWKWMGGGTSAAPLVPFFFPCYGIDYFCTIKSDNLERGKL